MKKKMIIIIIILIILVVISGLIWIVNRINSVKITDKDGKTYYAKEGDKVNNIPNCSLEIINIEETEIVVKVNKSTKTYKYGVEIPIYYSMNQSNGMFIESNAPVQYIKFEK